MAFWCECVSVRARVFPSDLWACARHTGPPKEPVGRRFRLKPPERTSGVCGAEAEGNEPRLRGPSPPRGGFSDFHYLQVPSFLFGFCKLRKVVSFFFALVKTPAGVAGCGETWCPSSEAGYPGTDTRVCNNTHSDSQADVSRGEHRQSPCLCARKVLLIIFTPSFCISTKRDASTAKPDLNRLNLTQVFNGAFRFCEREFNIPNEWFWHSGSVNVQQAMF